MTALELKNVLIHKKAIQTIIDAKTDHEVLPLAREQKDEIMASKKEIEKGLFVNHESLDEEINAWLNEK